MGTPLSQFTDFVATTGPAYLKGMDSVVNEMAKKSYLLKKFLKGGDHSFMLQGGSRIKDVLILDRASTAVNYDPDDAFNWVNPQFASTYALDWRFTADHYTWNKHEIALQAGGASGGALRGVFKNLKRMKEQGMWTSKINFMEDCLTAEPNKTTMEAQTGKVPMSIIAGLNEGTNGLMGANTVGGAWTTHQGLDPTVKARWAPQSQLYGSASPAADNAAVATRNILQAFDLMWNDVDYEAPPTRAEYFENADYGSMFIFCSPKGRSIYSNLCRASQDRFKSPEDPEFNSPSYSGIELVKVNNLTTAELYTGSSDNFTELHASATNRGPRYYWMHAKYAGPVFHTDNYFSLEGPKDHPNQPFTKVMICDTWWNFVFRSRQRHGVVAPSGTPYTG